MAKLGSMALAAVLFYRIRVRAVEPLPRTTWKR